jgi:hypothetical protein
LVLDILARQPPPPVDGAVVVVEDVSDVADDVVEAAIGAVVSVELSVVDEAAVDVVGASVVEGASVVVAAAAEEAVDVVVDDVSVVAEAAVDAAVDVAADEAVVADEEDAQTVAVVGSVVKAVTVKSGVPPCVQVQHGSPKAAPLVISELGKVSAQKAAVQESPTASKAVAKSVYWELSLSGCPSSCEKSDPLGM